MKYTKPQRPRPRSGAPARTPKVPRRTPPPSTPPAKRRVRGRRVGGRRLRVPEGAMQRIAGRAGYAVGVYAGNKVGNYIKRRWRDRRRNPTKTIRKKPPMKLTQNIMPEPSGAASRSYYKRNYRRNRNYYKSISGQRPTVFSTLYSRNTTASNGVQAIVQFNPGDVNNYRDLLETMNNRDPNTVTINDTERNFDVCMRSLQQTLVISNASLCTSYVKIYEVEPRKDISIGPNSAWFGGIDLQETNTSPSAAIPMTTPFDSVYFCKQFVIKRVINVELPQGSSHIHRSTMNLNYRMNGKAMDNSPNYVKGRSFFQLVVAYGAPVHDSVNEANVSTGEVQLDIVQRFSISGYKINITPKYLSLTNSLGTISNQEYISQGGSEVVGG